MSARAGDSQVGRARRSAACRRHDRCRLGCGQCWLALTTLGAGAVRGFRVVHGTSNWVVRGSVHHESAERPLVRHVTVIGCGPLKLDDGRERAF
jgi:hypothetical protein